MERFKSVRPFHECKCGYNMMVILWLDISSREWGDKVNVKQNNLKIMCIIQNKSLIKCLMTSKLHTIFVWQQYASLFIGPTKIFFTLYKSFLIQAITELFSKVKKKKLSKRKALWITQTRKEIYFHSYNLLFILS